MVTNNPNDKKALAEKKPVKKAPKPQPLSTRRLLSDLFGEIQGLGQGWQDRAWGLVRNLEKARDVEQNNYELGLRHLALRNLSDAIFRFRFVTWLNPKRAEAWYFLGCSYMAAEKKPQARDALRRALALKPLYEEANYMLALLGGAESLPRKMPLGLAREYFDSLAATFTHDQLEEFDYKGHILLSNAVRAQLVPGRLDHTVLELGVGTGLCGSQLRDVCLHITGVDLSQLMLKQAMQMQDKDGKKIYDALIERDMGSFLKEAHEDAYDVVLASNVFSYVGDLKEVSAQIARVLKTGGLCAFTADKLDKGEDFVFDPSKAHFRFSQHYLESVAVSCGLKVVKITEAEIYPETIVYLCIFRK